jgi:hypothetical protein
MRFFRTAAMLTALSLAAACGSTVKMGSAAPGSVDAGSGLSAPLAQGGTGEGGGTSGGPLGGASTGSGSATTTGGSGTVPSTTDGGSLPGARHVTSVHVGVIYLKGLDQAYAALGASSKSSDSHATYEAVFRYLNSTHAAGGVKLVPSYYAIDASSPQSQATQVEAACQFFTNDHHVDIVVSYTRGSGGGLPHCLGSKGIPLVNGFSEANTDDATFSANPLYWEPSQLSLDTLGHLLARHLVGSHYLDARWPSAASCTSVKGARLGVITFDRPEWRAAYERSLAPAFKALGHPVYDVVFVSVSGSTAQQVSQASSAAQSAVLKFSSECVDHVVFMSNVALDYLFMDIAQQQGYRPRYGLSSLEAPPIVIGNLTNAASQLHGAMGPGWSPYSDVDLADFDATAKAPGALCLKILTKEGVAPTDNNSATLALPSCEGPLFVAAVVSRWARAQTSTSMLDVVNALASSYRPSGAYTARLGPSRHAGATTYRAFAFVDGCGCFRYTSGLRATP